MIKVIPFEPEHIYGMKPLIENENLESALLNMDYLNALKQLGAAFSGFTPDGKCVGAAGIKQINSKTYEGWAILSKDSNKHIKSILRAVDMFIKNYFEFDVANRIQATVRLSYDKGHRFARLLGFSPEGILHNYEYGEDYMMYGRVNTWL